MISLNQFRIHIYQIIKILAKTGATLEISYGGKAYELFLRPSNAKVRIKYSPRPQTRKQKLNPHKFDYEGCLKCGELKVNGVCLNKKCSSSLPNVA
jgi:hypothetical protein